PVDARSESWIRETSRQVDWKPPRSKSRQRVTERDCAACGGEATVFLNQREMGKGIRKTKRARFFPHPPFGPKGDPSPCSRAAACILRCAVSRAVPRIVDVTKS